MLLDEVSAKGECDEETQACRDDSPMISILNQEGQALYFIERLIVAYNFVCLRIPLSMLGECWRTSSSMQSTRFLQVNATSLID
jgi:hypothetical protein